MAFRLIDISREISPDSVVYPGDEPLEMERVAAIGPESAYNLTKLGWNTHFLTHIDPPRHFVKDGASVTDLPLERFFGDAIVVEVEGPVILPIHIPAGDEIEGKSVLFKTDHIHRWDPTRFLEDHVYLSPEAAQLLCERGVNLVGIDYLDIDRFGDETYPTHQILLGADIPILEGLDLSKVSPGRYGLVALPLKIKDGDGSPVRAALIPWEDFSRLSPS